MLVNMRRRHPTYMFSRLSIRVWVRDSCGPYERPDTSKLPSYMVSGAILEHILAFHETHWRFYADPDPAVIPWIIGNKVPTTISFPCTTYPGINVFRWLGRCDDVQLTRCCTLDRAAFGVLSQCRRIKVHRITASTSVEGLGDWMLEFFSACETVDLRGWYNISDAALNALSDCKVLKLQDMPSDISSAKRIFPNLVELELVNTFRTPPDAFRFCPSLRRLTVFGQRLSFNDTVGKWLKNCEELEFQRCPGITSGIRAYATDTWKYVRIDGHIFEAPFHQ